MKIEGEDVEGVLFDGPYPDVNREGDEVPTWYVTPVAEDSEDFGAEYCAVLYDYAEGLRRAQELAALYGVELILEALDR